MKKVFTREFMLANCGCYSEEQLLECSFMNNEKITLKSILDSEIPIKDKYWFVIKKLTTIRQKQQIAITCAKFVLPIYESKYPNDNRPRLAIEKAENYLAGKCTIKELREKRIAVTAAAYAAAYVAAYAVDAYVAADAAYGDAYAAAVYSVAAYAVDAYVAADAAINNNLLILLKEFCKVK